MKSILLIVLLFYIDKTAGQDPAEYVRTHAIRIESPGKLNDSVYDLLSTKRLIMVGEMHGTEEPAQFVAGLVELFISKGDSVMVGLEIPSSKMETFVKYKTDSSVYASEFFAHPKIEDGRQCEAWSKLISHVNREKKAQLFFFDINEGEGPLALRDSFMYEKIKYETLHSPQKRIITLSGNYHNRTNTDEINAGMYLNKDWNLYDHLSIYSINLYYSHGTMANNSGNGVEIKSVNVPESVVSKTVPYDYFIMQANPAKNYEYDAIIFCREIHASLRKK